MVNGELVLRAYSVVSSPFDENWNSFLIVVPDGAFVKLQHLEIGDKLYLDKTAYGVNFSSLSIV